MNGIILYNSIHKTPDKISLIFPNMDSLSALNYCCSSGFPLLSGQQRNSTQIIHSCCGKNASINSHWPCQWSPSPKFDNVLESISKSGTEQGFRIDHEVLKGSRTVSLPAALLLLILKTGCQSIVCEVLHGLFLRSVFCVLKYHPLKCICHCWHLGKAVRSGRTPLISFFPVQEYFTN